MNRRLIAPCCTLAAVLACAVGSAHELRPALLDLREEHPGGFAVLWKTPMLNDARLALVPEFSGVAQTSEMTTRVRSGAAIQEWTLRVPDLRGQEVRIRGLEGTMTDVIVRISFADGSTWTRLLTPRAPAAKIQLLRRTDDTMGRVARSSFPLITAIAAWGVVCASSAIARIGRASGRHKTIVVAAYAAGTVATYWLVRAVVQFQNLI